MSSGEALEILKNWQIASAMLRLWFRSSSGSPSGGRDVLDSDVGRQLTVVVKSVNPSALLLVDANARAVAPTPRSLIDAAFASVVAAGRHSLEITFADGLRIVLTQYPQAEYVFPNYPSL
jgi:hypothetical protein